MHSHSTAPWTHGHAFLGVRHGEHERRTWGVVALTAAMMLVEIVGGGLFGSIALIADGWHMATHVIALAIAGFAYLFARRHARDARFSLGTGKFGELAAFASAIILGLIALGVGYESVLRLAQWSSISRRRCRSRGWDYASISRVLGFCARNMITSTAITFIAVRATTTPARLTPGSPIATPIFGRLTYTFSRML
jgi:cation diffusion facilitator family transporter